MYASYVCGFAWSDMMHGWMVCKQNAPRWLQFHVAVAICQRCKYTTSVDIQKTRYKKLVTHVEPHASAVSLLRRAENSAIQKLSIIIIIDERTPFTARFWMSAKVVYLPRCLVVTRLVPRETAAVSRYVYTIQLSTSLQCRFNPGYIRKVHVCLAVICHLHFWQNAWNRLRAIAVTAVI